MTHETGFQRLRRRFNAIFLLTVALPTALAIAFYSVLASEVYISESRFVVRSPQRSNQTGLGALLQSTGFSRSQDDTYSVHDYVLSRDALRELDEDLKLRQAFSAPEIDVWNRFPTEPWDKSFEALHRHYLRHVDITYDAVSSISVLRVRAYTAEQAQAINERLLEMGERLVNTMNIRSRQDLIQVAEQEVQNAERRAKTAADALSAFRSDRSVFDPNVQSALQLQGVARLRDELFAASVQLDQVRRVSPQNPQLATLNAQVLALEKAIADDNARVVGRDNGLSAKSAVYDRLTLEKVFADRQLAGALAGLDVARNEAARKQTYLERLVSPNLPDSAVEPRRLRSIVTVFVVGLLLWGIVSLVVASVREHQN